MLAQQIGQNLAFINWVLLATLAVGCQAAVVLGRFATGATKGYLGATSLAASAFGALAYLSDTALPATTTAGSPVLPDPGFDDPRRLALLAFALLAAVQAVLILRGGRGRWPAAVTGAAAAAATGTVLFAGLGWGGGVPAGLPLVLELAVLALATGGVFAAMVLGHWYLVTPKLPERPLVLLARALLAVVVIQVGLFVASMALGGAIGGRGVGGGGSGGAAVGGSGVPAGQAGGSGGPFGPLVGPWALFVWLRLLVGLVFPLVVSWAAVQTARTRSMESATGLLYIDVGAIAAGTILAAGLYFGAGLLV